MTDSASAWVSRWVVVATLLGAVLSALAYAGGFRYASHVTALTVVGVTYVLYRWGQHRDPPSKDVDDEQRRREKEMEAEAGGYGGNF